MNDFELDIMNDINIQIGGKLHDFSEHAAILSHEPAEGKNSWFVVLRNMYTYIQVCTRSIRYGESVEYIVELADPEYLNKIKSIIEPYRDFHE